MTKRIAALLAVLLLLAGCGAADGWRVKVQEKDAVGIDMLVTSPVVNLQQTAGEGKYGYFLITIEELTARLNAFAIADGIPQLCVDEMFDNLLSLDGMKGFLLRITIDSDTEYISEIKLNLFTISPEEAEIVGKYIYYLLDMFTENKAERIANTLYLFGQAPKSTPPVRRLVCGNTVYSFIEKDVQGPGDLYVRPAFDPAWEQKQEPDDVYPIRPEA